MMKRLFAVLLVMLGCAVMGFAQFAGSWHGVVDIANNKLPVVFKINDLVDKYTACMDSPSQGAKDIPADVSISGDTIKFDISAIGLKYSGVLADGVIKGVLMQHGYSFPLALEPGDYIPPRPQTPHPPFPYSTEEVSFTNPADGYEFHGTLTLPLLYNPEGSKKYDVVVMVTGSGIQNRDEEINYHKPFAVLANHLAMHGIASLRYDDRGYGHESATELENITLASNLSDAEAALNYVRDNFKSLGKLGILGHSEGGTIALVAAGEGKADFVVSLAGTAVRGDSILLKQNEVLLRPQLGDKTDDYLTALTRTYKFISNHPKAKEWKDIDKSLADLHLSPELVDNIKLIIKTRPQWLDHFIAFDPTNRIKRIEVPVFAANGSLDVQVDSKQNLAALRRNLPYNASSIIKEYPGLNHLMQQAITGLPAEYGAIEQTISPTLLNDLTTWLKSLK